MMDTVRLDWRIKIHNVINAFLFLSSFYAGRIYLENNASGHSLFVDFVNVVITNKWLPVWIKILGSLIPFSAIGTPLPLILAEQIRLTWAPISLFPVWWRDLISLCFLCKAIDKIFILFCSREPCALNQLRKHVVKAPCAWSLYKGLCRNNPRILLSRFFPVSLPSTNTYFRCRACVSQGIANHSFFEDHETKAAAATTTTTWGKISPRNLIRKSVSAFQRNLMCCRIGQTIIPAIYHHHMAVVLIDSLEKKERSGMRLSAAAVNPYAYSRQMLTRSERPQEESSSHTDIHRESIATRMEAAGNLFQL